MKKIRKYLAGKLFIWAFLLDTKTTCTCINVLLDMVSEEEAHGDGPYKPEDHQRKD